MRQNTVEKTLQSLLDSMVSLYKIESQSSEDYYRRVTLLPYMKQLLHDCQNAFVDTKNFQVKLVQLCCFIGVVLSATGEFVESEEVLTQALAKSRKNLPSDHPVLGQLLNFLSYTYLQQNKGSEALELLCQAIKINDKASIQRIMTLNRLGMVHILNKDYDQAIQYLQEALTLNMNLFKEKNPMYARSLTFLGEAYMGQGLHEDAEKALQQALEIKTARYDSSHPSLALTLKVFSHLKKAQNDIEQRKKYLSKSLEIEKAVYGCDHPYTRGTIEELNELKMTE